MQYQRVHFSHIQTRVVTEEVCRKDQGPDAYNDELFILLKDNS